MANPEARATRYGGIPVIGHVNPMPNDRLPGFTDGVDEGDTISDRRTRQARVLFIPVPHVAATSPTSSMTTEGRVHAATCCSRQAAGARSKATRQQMFDALVREAREALPADTRVYCGHEYTESNLRFAITVEPDNTDDPATSYEQRPGRSARNAAQRLARRNARPR